MDECALRPRASQPPGGRARREAFLPNKPILRKQTQFRSRRDGRADPGALLLCPWLIPTHEQSPASAARGSRMAAARRLVIEVDGLG